MERTNMSNGLNTLQRRMVFRQQKHYPSVQLLTALLWLWRP